MLNPENVGIISFVVSLLVLIAFIVWHLSLYNNDSTGCSYLNFGSPYLNLGYPYLRVMIEFPDLKIMETVIIRDFSVFEVILPDVIIHSWSFNNENGESVAGCAGPDSLKDILSYFENLTPTKMNVSFSN